MHIEVKARPRRQLNTKGTSSLIESVGDGSLVDDAPVIVRCRLRGRWGIDRCNNETMLVGAFHGDISILRLGDNGLLSRGDHPFRSGSLSEVHSERRVRGSSWG